MNEIPQREVPPGPGWRPALYWACVIVGGVIALYLYFIAFNRLTETLLVRLTVVWVFPLVIGIYGLMAEKLFRLLDDGQAATLWEAARVWAAAAGVLGLIVLIPFLVVKVRNSLLVALAAAVFWAGLLVVFFELVFPQL